MRETEDSGQPPRLSDEDLLARLPEKRRKRLQRIADCARRKAGPQSESVVQLGGDGHQQTHCPRCHRGLLLKGISRVVELIDAQLRIAPDRGVYHMRCGTRLGD